MATCPVCTSEELLFYPKGDEGGKCIVCFKPRRSIKHEGRWRIQRGSVRKEVAAAYRLGGLRGVLPLLRGARKKRVMVRLRWEFQ
jgi:hypothetical protein